MGAGGIADEADAVRIEIEFGGLGADELDGGLDVVDRGRIDAGLAQPVIDGKNRIAGAGEEQAPIAIELLGCRLASRRHVRPPGPAPWLRPLGR